MEVSLSFLMCNCAALSNFETKNVDDCGEVNGLGGWQNWMIQQMILLWTLSYFHGAPLANISHLPKVWFTVLR